FAWRGCRILSEPMRRPARGRASAGLRRSGPTPIWLNREISMKGAFALAAAALALAAPAQAEWVASWAAAPHAPLGTEGPFAAASYDNVTISQILRVTEGGERLRIRLSNRYGPGPLEIGAAR